MSDDQFKVPAIYPALAHVMASIDAVGKDSVNKFQNFNYRSIDAVMNEIHGHMARAKIVTVPKYSNCKRELIQKKDGKFETSVSLEGIVHFVSCEDGSHVEAGPFYAEAFDSSDKATTKAMSMLLKYALLQFFLIPTAETKDGDADSPPNPHRQDRDNRPASQNQNRPQNRPAQPAQNQRQEPRQPAQNRQQNVSSYVSERTPAERAIMPETPREKPVPPTQPAPSPEPPPEPSSEIPAPPLPSPEPPREKPIGNRKRCDELKTAYGMADSESEIDAVRELANQYTWGDLGLQQLIDAETNAKDRVAKKARPASAPASQDTMNVHALIMNLQSSSTLDECHALYASTQSIKLSREDRGLLEGVYRERVDALTPKPSNRPTQRDALVARFQSARSLEALKLLAPNPKEWSAEDRAHLRGAYEQCMIKLRSYTTHPPASVDPYATDRYGYTGRKD